MRQIDIGASKGIIGIEIWVEGDGIRSIFNIGPIDRENGQRPILSRTKAARLPLRCARRYDIIDGIDHIGGYTYLELARDDRSDIDFAAEPLVLVAYYGPLLIAVGAIHIKGGFGISSACIQGGFIYSSSPKDVVQIAHIGRFGCVLRQTPGERNGEIGP